MARCGSADGKKVSRRDGVELESDKPEAKKRRLMSGDDDVSPNNDNKFDESDEEDVSPNIYDNKYDASDDEDASPMVKVVLYDRNSTDHVPDSLLTEYARLAVDHFNNINGLASYKSSMVHLVRASSQVCNGLLLDLRVRVKRLHTDSLHTIKANIWYKGGLPTDADILVVIASRSFSWQEFKSDSEKV